VFPNAHGGGTFGDGGGGIFPEQFGCQPHRRAEEYFDALKRNPPPQSSKPQPKAGWGKGCGSGSGGIAGPEELKVQADAGRDAVEQALQQKADAQAIQGAVQASTGGRAGTVPQGLARFAEACLEPAKVRWEQKLARSVRSAVTFQAGQGDFTWTRRARGQAALESIFGEACPVMPGEHAPRVEVAFAVDTSGSIGEPELRTIVREATGVLKNMGGAKITVLACDATVHSVARVRRPGDIRKGLKGGGGTLFQPVFDALQRVRPRPNVLIYATDGYAFDTAALRQPAGVTVIWLIIEGGQNSVPWGEVIHVN
jgi:predicted metal-dependent peptidase